MVTSAVLRNSLTPGLTSQSSPYYICRECISSFLDECVTKPATIAAAGACPTCLSSAEKDGSLWRDLFSFLDTITFSFLSAVILLGYLLLFYQGRIWHYANGSSRCVSHLPVARSEERPEAQHHRAEYRGQGRPHCATSRRASSCRH